MSAATSFMLRVSVAWRSPGGSGGGASAPWAELVSAAAAASISAASVGPMLDSLPSRSGLPLGLQGSDGMLLVGERLPTNKTDRLVQYQSASSSHQELNMCTVDCVSVDSLPVPLF
jgi:hypothetical protein